MHPARRYDWVMTFAVQPFFWTCAMRNKTSFSAAILITIAALAGTARAQTDNLISAGAAYSHPQVGGVSGLKVDDQGGPAIEPPSLRPDTEEHTPGTGARESPTEACAALDR
jgi:hypothetical protein